MKIAIDIRTAAGEKAGKGWYTFYITKNLLKLDTKNKYILYTKNIVPGFNEFKNAIQKVVVGPSLFWHKRVAKDAAKEKVDIFFAPSSYIIPALLPPEIKSIITVHDLVAFLYPKSHNKKAVFLEKLFLKRAIKRAAKIITVSKNTKQDLIEKFNISSQNIETIYCGASEKFKPLKKEDLTDFIKKTNLPQHFFLAVGTIIPRKNYYNLIRAFAAFSTKYPHHHLIIVGSQGWKSEEVIQLIERSQLTNKVHLLGYLSTPSLVNLYNLAEALVFPSFYEGFGIPLLEAMKCGCPVIASNCSSIPEVVGDSAIFLDPDNYESILVAMTKLVSNPSLSAELKEKGLAESKKFSWQSSAKELLKLMKSI